MKLPTDPHERLSYLESKCNSYLLLVYFLLCLGALMTFCAIFYCDVLPLAATIMLGSSFVVCVALGFVVLKTRWSDYELRRFRLDNALWDASRHRPFAGDFLERTMKEDTLWENR